MAWQDRNYNPGRENLNSFFAAPANLLQLSVPIYRSAGLHIRIHFWFLLVAVFTAIAILRAHQPLFYIPLDIAILLVAVLLHELGHRIFARAVGGNHWEWVLWPLGGMVAPSCPRTPKAVFIANIGGIAFSLPLAILAFTALHLIPGTNLLWFPTFSPFTPLIIIASHANPVLAVAVHATALFCSSCIAITIINLFPCFWFDGGHLWHSLLWPKFGASNALSFTCMAGMILAVPFFLLALWGTDFLGLVVWALIFADCFSRRRALIAAGPGALDEQEVTYNYMDTPTPRVHKKASKRWFNAARKRALAEQAQQAQIDAILDKVKQKGLHSLFWFEKRALKKATERQRQSDLAERM